MINQEALDDRGDQLEARSLNGIDQLVVRLADDHAVIDVLLHTAHHVAALVADPDPRAVFPITGGRRLRGGPAPGEVQVTAVAAGTDPRSVRLIVAPIGDYSTYRLGIVHAGIDPVFAEAPFKFRPGCFTNDCVPRPRTAARGPGDPGIDYTAKDYASFRHLLHTALARRLPGWAPTSEADLMQLLVDHLAAAADELSDYQDRVVHERALATARSRISLARHARLVDYHIHQGNQAATWLALEVGAGADRVIGAGLVPATGREHARDPERRQLVRLVPPAVIGVDPVTSATYVRVRWRAEDALRAPYCATAGDPPLPGATRVSGNLVEVFHGGGATATFAAPDQAGPGELAWRPTRWGVLCPLPGPPVLYLDTPPGGEVPAVSTVAIEVRVGATIDRTWDERESLIHARAGERVFAVETDELGRSQLRFGTGDRGAELPDGARVVAAWQAGDPLAGNVGAGAIARCSDPAVVRCWNPFDVTSARAPEPREQIVRRAPELYRARQLRWVTLDDAVARAEELPDVARAAARYVWTGSWTAVRLAIDPAGTEMLTDEVRARVAAHLAPVALIGDDLELRAPRAVPVEIVARVCIDPGSWREHVLADIVDELSDGVTAGGRRGLFHPDAWTFGESLHASQVIGRIQAVPGVAHVVSVELRRYRAPTPGPSDRIEVGIDEIIQCRNDPDDMERGSITLHPVGGRG